MSKNDAKKMALDFLDFLNRSPTPYHAVENSEKMLKSAGFVEVTEEDTKFRARAGDKCYKKKGQTTLFAFVVGEKWNPENGGISMVATHTDSCFLRVKPVSRKSAEGFLQLGVAPYGGGIWRTWFDRDLSLAGLAVFRRRNSAAEILEHVLVDLKRPIAHIPSLAIHLDTKKGNEIEFNLEQHLCPILASTSFSPPQENGYGAENTSEKDHHPQLLQAVATAAGCEPDELIDLDLFMYDTQPACLSGLHSEFISGSRLDNLVSTFCALRALIDSVPTLDQNSNIRLVSCYDHEEVGSESAQGAMSATTEWLLRRLCQCPGDTCAFERCMARSFLISADKAHATHPNYPERHEDNHRVRFGAGPVVKYNLCTLRFASSAMSEAVMQVIAKRAQVPLQKYIFRNDAVRGSTIGPILAARLGIQTVDIGCQPQLAMHSIRELGDSVGILQSVQLFKAFFDHLPGVLENVRRM